MNAMLSKRQAETKGTLDVVTKAIAQRIASSIIPIDLKSDYDLIDRSKLVDMEH